MILTITGRMGSGKDTVMSLLPIPSTYRVLNADSLGHELLRDQEIIRLISLRFPGAVIDGQIDRTRLAKLVFPQRIRELNSIVHPRLRNLIRSQLTANTVIHAALLRELGLRALSDKVLLVSVRQSIILNRLSARMYPRQILKRLRTQASDFWYRRHADLILDNNGTLEALKEQVLTLCRNLF